MTHHELRPEAPGAEGFFEALVRPPAEGALEVDERDDGDGAARVGAADALGAAKVGVDDRGDRRTAREQRRGTAKRGERERERDGEGARAQARAFW